MEKLKILLLTLIFSTLLSACSQNILSESIENMYSFYVSENLDNILWEDIIKAKYNEVDQLQVPGLTNEEEYFLEKHIYGQWKFTERLYGLDQSKNIHFDKLSNFSDIGVEELKEHTVIYFSKNLISPIEGISQNTLSDARDMYLYLMWGGFDSSFNPIYDIEKLNRDIIHLEDLYYSKGHDIQLSGSEKFLKITYDLYNESESYSMISFPHLFGGRSLADVLYVDPSNTDVIYLEFCGLWKMERDNNNYNTGGKSEY